MWIPAFALGALLAIMPTHSCDTKTETREAGANEVAAYFREQKRSVLTFLGYSGAGYENPALMLEQASRILDTRDPSKTLVNIGATAEGIGTVYELAKRRGFHTTGIVSTQARDQKVPLSPCVDVVFFITDTTWGGLLPGTQTLAPTSQAMVSVSNEIVAIGGGEVARDELLAARAAGKTVMILPADMHHPSAKERAKKKGQPEPTDFGGPVSALAQGQSPSRP